MNAYMKASEAYASSAANMSSPRATEFKTLSRTTRQLQSAKAPAEIVEALHQNRRLWRALATDLANPGNALPEDLRKQLLSLAAFVEQRTSGVLSGFQSPYILVELNKSIMRGLRQKEITP